MRATLFKVLTLCLVVLSDQTARAEGLRIAFWNVELTRKGPGLLLRDILRRSDPQVATIAKTIDSLNADLLVLAGIDFDAEGLALAALNAQLAKPFAHLRPLRPNTGLPSGFDLDGNGRRDEARDAIGFGTFPGQGGMALLSTLPIDEGQSRDFNTYLWQDLPGNLRPSNMPATLPLSTTGHHDTAITLQNGQTLRLLTWHATTPAFDGPDDRNGRRNHDETAFWLALLSAKLQLPPPLAPYVLIGQANADPIKGDGRPDAIRALLASPLLQDALGQKDTVDYGGPIGPLRVAYILPSTSLTVIGSGLAAPNEASRHWPIWIDIRP